MFWAIYLVDQSFRICLLLFSLKISLYLSGCLKLTTFNEENPVNFFLTFDIRTLITMIRSLLKEIQHPLQFLLWQSREDSKFFEKVNLIIDLPLKSVSDYDLIIVLVNNRELCVDLAHNCSVSRLVCHKSQFAKSFPTI